MNRFVRHGSTGIALPISISGDINSNYKLEAGTVTVPGEIIRASTTATIEPIAG